MSTNNTDNISPDPENLSFEEVLSQLELTVQSLEQGDLSLKEATRLYEEGIHLSRICNQILDKAELKVTQLKATLSENTSECSSDFVGTQAPTEE